MKKQMLSLFLALALTGCAAPGPGAPPPRGRAERPHRQRGAGLRLPGGERYDRREAIERPEIGAEVVIDPPYDFDPAEMDAWRLRGLLHRLRLSHPGEHLQARRGDRHRK